MLYATAAIIAFSGCAAHLHGIVRADGVGTRLEAPNGRKYRMVLGPAVAPLARLDGEMVYVDGQRGLGALRVTGYTVPQGPHGMPAWIGTLRALGVQLGIDDRNSRVFYLFDAPSARALWDAQGHAVLLEGYVMGPNTVHVTWWQDLDSSATVE